MAPYWPDGEAAWSDETPLLATDISSAPRLSAFAFEQRFGIELDLPDLSAHLFATEQVTPDLVLPETVWRQRLRGVAATAIALIEASQAEVIFVPHGAEVLSRLLAVVASALKRRVLFWESGFFPGHLYLDAQAPHFFRGLARIDGMGPPQEPSTATVAFRDAWREKRLSKYPQAAASRGELTQWLSADSRPVVFLAGQVPSDANAVVGLGRFDSLGELYRATLTALPPHWRLLYKPHPLAPHDPLQDACLSDDRFLRLDIDIRDAIEASDVVLTHSSNVGLEALLLGKPVMVLGRPIYSGRGFTLDLNGPEDLTKHLAMDPPARPDDIAVLTFLELLLNEASLADGDASAILRRLSHSAPGAPQGARAPWYGNSVRALVSASSAIQADLKRHVRLDRALTAMNPGDRQTLESRLDQKELLTHRFGGMAVPPNRYAPRPMPDLDPLLGYSATYGDLRPEDCIDPATAIAEDGAQIFQITSNAGSAPDDAYFALADLTPFAERLNACLIGFCDRTLVPAEAADRWLLILPGDKAPPAAPELAGKGFIYRPWRIPAEAFSFADDVVAEGESRLLTMGSRHSLFGPYIEIPPGPWRMIWRDLSQPRIGDRLRAFFGGAQAGLAIHVVGHGPDGEHVVSTAPFAQGHLSFVSKADHEYEVRSVWSGPRKPGRIIARFDGVRLEPIEDDAIDGSPS